MFPSLVNCCTIDWFSQWPKDALYSVANRFLEFIDFGAPEAQHALAQLFMHIHTTVTDYSVKFYEELRRHNYTTPTSYLELINLYTTLLTEQREAIRQKVIFCHMSTDILTVTYRFRDCVVG